MGLQGKIWPSTFIFGAILLLSMVLPLPQGGKILGLPALCAFNNLTGLPCPGCGLTRAFVAMGHGQFAESLRWHPLGPALWAAFALYFGLSLVLALRFPSVKFPFRWQLYGFGALGVVLVAFWILRLNGTFPLPTR